MINEAVAAERLAAIVSYGPDKAKLLAQAAALRSQARLEEARTWRPRGERRT